MVIEAINFLRINNDKVVMKCFSGEAVVGYIIQYENSLLRLNGFMAWENRFIHKKKRSHKRKLISLNELCRNKLAGVVI